MARSELRHPENAPGEWFVDTRCIDCGTCRELSPELFGERSGQSIVTRQPEGEAGPGSELGAWLAAQACPTTSIGTSPVRPRPGRLYPREIEHGSDVWDLGYCSEDSFGASSWFAVRPGGNVMVDSPRWTEALAVPLAERGGVDHVVLTHRDDVADARRWAERFGSRVWIHADDASVAPWATDLIEGVAPVPVTDGLLAVPTAGHTKGSVVYLLDDRYLFTGDSLAWSHHEHDLIAFRYACWWSWPAQTESLARLAEGHRFAWVLPGHGARTSGDPAELHDRLERLVERMRQR
jgi:glyoxylase-like metal-dependent hydrolase (beta-lactamase superfamily II)/ferredoxin